MSNGLEGSGMGDVTDADSLETSWEERGVLMGLGALTIMIAVTDIQWVVSSGQPRTRKTTHCVTQAYKRLSQPMVRGAEGGTACETIRIHLFPHTTKLTSHTYPERAHLSAYTRAYQFLSIACAVGSSSYRTPVGCGDADTLAKIISKRTSLTCVHPNLSALDSLACRRSTINTCTPSDRTVNGCWHHLPYFPWCVHSCLAV